VERITASVSRCGSYVAPRLRTGRRGGWRFPAAGVTWACGAPRSSSSDRRSGSCPCTPLRRRLRHRHPRPARDGATGPRLLACCRSTRRRPARCVPNAVAINRPSASSSTPAPRRAVGAREAVRRAPERTPETPCRLAIPERRSRPGRRGTGRRCRSRCRSPHRRRRRRTHARTGPNFILIGSRRPPA
jgi:hypothetical protein